MTEPCRYVVDANALPARFPTHKHNAEFWENLGRAVGTFGFLEEVLGKAIFAFTATKPYSEEEALKAYKLWLPKLEHALHDQLGNLINAYGKAVREHPESTIENLDELLGNMRAAARVRNVICHGSWRGPDAAGASVPFFVNQEMQRFDTAIDSEYLCKLQRHVSELICAVVNTVTHMGWQFPGSKGPGEVIWESER